MEAGRLVSDDLVLAMIRERLAERDAVNGFVFDGFPRNNAQAQALDAMLERVGQPLNFALLIDIDPDILMQRMTGRRTCESCGAVYNVYSSPPKLEDRCDRCGGNLRHRADDNEETIGNRLRVYEAQTAPVIDYYRAQGKLKTVQGVGEIPHIFAAIRGIVDEFRRQARARPPASKGEERAIVNMIQDRAAAARAKTAPKQPASAAAKPAERKPAAKSAARPPAKRPPAKKKAPAKSMKRPKPVRKPSRKKAVAKKKVTTRKKAAARATARRRGGAAKKAARRMSASRAGKRVTGKRKGGRAKARRRR
jgi:adenylate kinase